MSMGAHVAVRTPAPTLFLALLMVISFVALSFGASDIDFLLKFKDSLEEKSALDNWNPSKDPCSWSKPNWKGVRCSNGTVRGLKLEHMRLKGLIDIDALGSLKSIRTISLMNNEFEGPLPDLKRIRSLRSLYLSNNHFSGDIPDNAFFGMEELKKFHIANNSLTGNIPSSLVGLPKLEELRLEANQFEGIIPGFKQDVLKVLSLANNQLEGPIPPSLSKMESSFFTGNKNLCGPPLDPCKVSMKMSTNQEGQDDNNNNNKKSIVKIVIIVIIVGIALGTIAAALTIFRCKKQTS